MKKIRNNILCTDWETESIDTGFCNPSLFFTTACSSHFFEFLMSSTCFDLESLFVSVFSGSTGPLAAFVSSRNKDFAFSYSSAENAIFKNETVVNSLLTTFQNTLITFLHTKHSRKTSTIEPFSSARYLLTPLWTHILHESLSLQSYYWPLSTQSAKGTLLVTPLPGTTIEFFCCLTRECPQNIIMSFVFHTATLHFRRKKISVVNPVRILLEM